MSAYETFEHTADIGLRMTAADVEGLFAAAGRGLFSLIVENLDAVRTTHAIEVALEASDLDGLLVDWLSELLYHFETARLVGRTFEVRIDAGRLTATVRGEPLDEARHETHLHVKALTYHGLRVEQTDDGWRAEVIVDI